jgi:hypothetical protein
MGVVAPGQFPERFPGLHRHLSISFRGEGENHPLGELTGRDHTHLALNKEDEKIRFRDIQAQPRKIISRS